MSSGEYKMISKNIMKLSEWKGTSVWYRASCSCGGGEDCDCDIEFEIDKDFGFISLNFNKKIAYSSYYNNDFWFQRLWSNIKAAFKIMFTGYINMEASFMIQGDDQLDAFLEALTEGKDKVKLWREEFERENKHED